METTNIKLKKLMQTALLAALCYVSFTFLQIKIPVPGGDSTSLHIGNAFCVLAALLLGGSYGGLAFNVIADPVVGFFYKQYVLGQPQEFAKVLAKLSAITTFANAVVSVILVAFLYNALRPLLTKANLLLPIYSKNKFTI